MNVSEIKKLVKSVPRTEATSNPSFREMKDGTVIIRPGSHNHALRIIETMRANGYNCAFTSMYYGMNALIVWTNGMNV